MNSGVLRVERIRIIISTHCEGVQGCVGGSGAPRSRLRGSHCRDCQNAQQQRRRWVPCCKDNKVEQKDGVRTSKVPVVFDR